ncbi:MAG TPA: ABC transporter [Firmicutes bacterium]|nr:ABC transporter [Bacillota bacterium]HAW72065.1 ABC transporter [Bacillota bacterium]HBE06672.1 ABC transporter [Bacillota bacterium]HBL49797.1 ABC transporter [Bacillota bacterium]HBR23658.1 ABC transporter [Bacillota bacterium]
MTCIKVKDLKKSYGSLQAVDGISFEVRPGEIYGLLGPNGAGKTTTIEMLVGLRTRDSGTVDILGYDPQVAPEKVKSGIGVQLQSPAMFPRLTVLELVELFASFYQDPLPVDEVIEMVGLTEKKKAQSRKLSGGQMHRLAIALAIVSNGRIIFLDEPTTGLDPQARRNLWEVILGLKKSGKAVFLTTHYMDEAEKLCDWVAIVDQGRIIAEGHPETLIDEHFKERALEFEQPAYVNEKRLEKLTGVKKIVTDGDLVTLYTETVSQTIAELFDLAKETGQPVNDIAVRRSTLEDLFLKLTGRRIRE